jgi:hypothetical protein
MTTQQYEKIIADVEKEFSLFLAKAENTSATLTKSDEASESASEEKKEEDKEEPKAEEHKEESASEEKKEEDKEEPKAEEDKKDEDSHDYSDEDVEEMHKMYGSMSKGELGLHKAATEKCWMAKCGEMTQMGKSEKDTIVSVSKEDSSLIKSKVETLEKENEELKKNVESLVNAMAKFVNNKKAPARKAITEIGFLNKSEEETAQEKTLSKSEITTILSRKAQEPTLSKSDREAIDKYYFGVGGIESIRHLLK